MRCPECEQRNSVAASKCKFCGAKFKRKSMPLGKKLILLLAGLVLVGVVYFSMQLPKMVDPAEQLSAAAKRVAAGPKSAEDAKVIKEAFDSAVEKMLKRYGSDNPTILSNKLKSLLPATAFEVLVVDLPKGLKLVEIDTILQASDFVVMKGTNDTKVFRLPGFEVFDDARSVSDQAGPVIVLLGHSGGQPPHRPMVRTYALLPDSIEDDSKNMVPAFSGEGTAKFAKDSGDISIELSASSVAQAEKLSLAPSVPSDKVVRLLLRWKDAKYQPEISAGADPQSYLLLLARNMKYPEYWPASAAYLGPSATKLLKEHSSPQIVSVDVKRIADKKGVQSFVMQASNKKFDLDLKPAGALWQLAGYKVTDSAGVTSAVSNAPVVVENKSDTGDVPQTNGASKTSTEAQVATTVVPTKSLTSNSTTSPVASAQTSSTTKSESINKTNSTGTAPGPKVLPSSLISSMPGPALAGKNVKVDEHSRNKGTGTAWLGDDEEKPHDNKHVAAIPPGVKKNLDQDKNADRNKKNQQNDAKANDSGSAGTISGSTGSVRMRSGPGLGKRTITEVPNGASIHILGQEKGWYRVRYGGKIGYVFGPLVSTSGKAPEPAQTQKSAVLPDKQANKNKQGSKEQSPKTVQTASHVTTPSANTATSSGEGSVIRRPMNVRDDSRRKIGVVQPGDRVTVLGSMKNERYKVRLSDGRVGWVHKDALGAVSANKIAPDTTGGAEVETPPEFVP